MSLPHPFAWLAPRRQRRAFLFFLVLALLVMTAIQTLNPPLVTSAAPAGIVSFELAGTLQGAQAIMASWGTEGQVYAALSLGLDYLFLLAYAGAISLGCALVGRNLESSLGQRSGLFLAWGVWAAAALDALENYALIRLLLGSSQGAWPPVAFWCATFKFLLVGAGLVYALLGAAWLGSKTLRRRSAG